jgi:hypothetical protein
MIISDLEAEGYLRKKREGRRLRYFINPDLPLRIDQGWRRYRRLVGNNWVGTS